MAIATNDPTVAKGTITKSPNRVRKPVAKKIAVPINESTDLPEVQAQEEIGMLLDEMSNQERDGVRKIVAHITSAKTLAYKSGYKKSVRYLRFWCGAAPTTFKLGK